jgi:DNA-directed RNA polymerase subunit N (RpoN/RPB10)
MDTATEITKSLLLIGSEPSFNALSFLLTAQKHVHINFETNANTCCKRMLTATPDLLIIDMQHLSRYGGLGLLQTIKEKGLLKKTHIIIITSSTCGRYILEKYNKYTKIDSIFKLPLNIKKLVGKIIEELK